MIERGRKTADGVYVFKTPVSPLNKIATNNRFSNMDFDSIYRDGSPYEHEEFPKAVAIPIPADDDLPDELQRKIREFESDGSIKTWVEPEKYWRQRIKRLWPNFYPVVENSAEETRVKAKHGVALPHARVKEIS